MPASVPFHYVDLRAFAYATEDVQRVEQALRLFLPEEHEVERSESEGHHGDRIVVFNARIESADGIRHVLDAVSELDDYETLVTELDDRIDEDCSLFVQFDKQAAFRGDVALGTGIMLRTKVEAYPAKREAAVENARTAFGELRD